MSSTNAKATPKSTSVDPAAADAIPQTSLPAGTYVGDEDFSFPTETEIYILPNGQVVFADLPVELIDLAKELGDWEIKGLGD